MLLVALVRVDNLGLFNVCWRLAVLIAILGGFFIIFLEGDVDLVVDTRLPHSLPFLNGCCVDAHQVNHIIVSLPYGSHALSTYDIVQPLNCSLVDSVRLFDRRLVVEDL